MKVKSPQWIEFKRELIEILATAEGESGKFDFPLEDEQDFSIDVNGCVVLPIFNKKYEMQKIEYDFSLCETKIRTLSFSICLGALRVELTLKNSNNNGS